MPKMRLNASVDITGPLFRQGKSRAAALRAQTKVNEVLAEETRQRLLAEFARKLQHPTGAYTSRIVVDRGQRYRGVSDSGQAYGGWLEGIDPRNRTTRFRGYHVFADVSATMRQAAVQLATPVVQELVREMNG